MIYKTNARNCKVTTVYLLSLFYNLTNVTEKVHSIETHVRELEAKIEKAKLINVSEKQAIKTKYEEKKCLIAREYSEKIRVLSKEFSEKKLEHSKKGFTKN